MKKIVLLAFVLVLLSTAMIGRFIRPVKAGGSIYIKADGSIEGTTDIMTVDNVTYTFTDNINDEIIVEKNNIVVDGAGYTLQGLPGSGIGIYLLFRSNVTIKNMEIKNFWAGIQLSYAFNNTISGNNITANDYYGIYITYASHNTISGNNITEPRYPPSFSGIFLDENSGNNIISGNNMLGFYLNGILGEGSSNNIISGNTMKDNFNGIWLSGGSNNRIYHNNFIDHSTDCSCPLSTTLDAGYPLGGNYWDRYSGNDLFSGLFQNETGSDGIGDTPYVMGYGNEDNYPLMGMFSDFNATSEHNVQTICNSSISDFQFNGTAICFNVTGENDTTGFCRICIPTALMNDTFRVFVNGTEILPSPEPLSSSNSTHNYLYFTYDHSTQQVIIIPEFPTWTSMLLILIVLSVAIAIYKRRLLKTPTH